MAQVSSSGNGTLGGYPSSLVVASMPWVFTQRSPLSSDGFISEAKRRGFDLDTQVIRELYRHRLLVPFVWAQNEPDPSLAVSVDDEPGRAGTLLTELRLARETGRLRDLASTTFRPHLPFARHARFNRRWWNGFLYSWHQLHVLSIMPWILEGRRNKWRGRELRVTLPAPHEHLIERATEFRRLAIAATALEARYLPKLDPEWVHVSGASTAEWNAYRDSFDPVATSHTLGYSATQAKDDAEDLLELAHDVDPLGRSWGKLARRAPKKAWDELKGPALAAMDMRQTAEILLLYYEDLAGRGLADPLPQPPSMTVHPMHDRLSYRDSTLDQDLMRLGISPHPRVVLAVEGESEAVHVPKVWTELGFREVPELVRLLRLDGVDRDLQKVAALAAAPLIGGQRLQGSWDLLKPPTCLMVAVDPEGKWSPDRAAKTREDIVDEIRSVLRAQGAKTTEEELGLLVEVRTWSASCYEFAHFDDDELADALMAVHETVNGLTRDELIRDFAKLRERSRKGHQRVDIKHVWSRWSYEPSKVALAEQLWLALKRKIDRCRAEEDAPVPEIVEVVLRAHATAQQWRYESFVLTAAEDPEDQ
ncbi:hypothetical protein ACWED2_04830 [Amycolatopsis sp. NPDC005003]